MANLSVDTIKSEDGSGPIVFDANLDFSQSEYTVLPKGTTAQRPTGVAAGSLRFNTDTKLVEQYNGIEWVTLNSYGVGRGVFGGGNSYPASGLINNIEYITISTTGNASYFGDLSLSRAELSACSSSTRGVFGGGGDDSPFISFNVIDYITIATTGNATDFGDLSKSTRDLSACSSSTRGVFGAGSTPSPTYTTFNTIEYITIATTGNATDFGDLTNLSEFKGTCSSSTRGIFAGGTFGSPVVTVNIIDYITIATIGNATDFGDLTVARGAVAGCSSSTRGVFGGGYDYVPTIVVYNTIDYITIATTGNAFTFGNLSANRQYLSSCSSSTRGVFGGGTITYVPAANPVNIIEYVTISTIGNATDFGDLTQSTDERAALSDAHGGLA
jgi:hypothetical protein